ncbi:MAG: CHASE2 domain-containing protein [Actinobacteria bacterium]|nr:CHASE2 domain-containing protein [Actinomycetota bacterium]
MAKSRRITAAGSHNLRNKATALAVGAAITALAVIAGAEKWFEPYELISYDKRMVWLNSIPANEKIVHIDIDDGSLETVGRWPWPREKLAELIETLSEAQASNIALDILFRQQEPSGDPRLAKALKEAGSVLVPTHFRMSDDTDEQTKWVVQLEKILQTDPFRLDGKELTPALVSKRLGADEMLVAQGFYRRRQETVDNQTLELLRTNKIKDDLGLLLKHYGLVDVGEGRPEYVVVQRAFRRAKSILESQRFGQVPKQALAPEAFSPGHIDPPIPELARAAGAVAFIANKPDPGGVYRRVPLLAHTGGYVYKQYSLALACEMLGVKDSQISYDSDGYLVLEGAAAKNQERHSVRIPVDRQGRMLINFRKGDNDWWWLSGFEHLSAGKILEITQLRQKIKNNANKRMAATREAIRRTVSEEALQEFDLLTKRIAELQGSSNQAELNQVKESWKAMQAEAIDTIRFIYNSLPPEAPSNPEELKEYRNIKLFYQDLVVTDYEAENQRLEEMVQESVATLTSKIKGKVCLVGSTASGGAGSSLDYASCPVFEREVPGIVVHANALNTILQEEFLRQIGRWQGLLIIAGCGILATVFSSLLKPLHSLGPVVGGIGAYLGINLLSFNLGVVLPLVLPIMAILISWAGVMAYRQLFEAREKRRMTTTLGQFTSPAVARRLLAQPELLSLTGEIRNLSCYFSDLKGFTTLSEELGPEKTVSLLNRYLDKMTEALFKHGATVNKFAGDGIFAFFGAPEVQPDHARRACLAAVDSQVALAKLCEELSEEGADELRMRVGINTGPAVVGNCGSSRKFDYTALGDTVNLASRLEPANKFFGSWILVSKKTFEEAALPENILSRPLGAIVAVGRTEATEVVELLGWDGHNEQMSKEIQRFSAGLEAYQKGQLKEALEIFESCLQIWPEDQPARVYAGLCRAAIENPPEGEWNPVIRQKEK